MKFILVMLTGIYYYFLKLQPRVRRNQDEEVHKVFEGKVIRGLWLKLVKDTLHNVVFSGAHILDLVNF